MLGVVTSLTDEADGAIGPTADSFRTTRPLGVL